jgi:hypothetical protein
MKLGLKPLIPDHRDLLFSKYRIGDLPKRPATFGYEDLIANWGMLANDQLGDCVEAGGCHETMLFNAMAGGSAAFTDTEAIHFYTEVTGYDPNNPATDQGTDMRAAAQFRQTTGIMDAIGTRHKIGAYMFIDPTNVDQMMEACWLFGAIGLGVNLPQSAMDQFNNGQPWAVASIFDWRGRRILGGHYVPMVADRGNASIVTWSKLWQVTTGFLQHYAMAAVAYVSPEMLIAGKSLQGFDLPTLLNDLSQLQA